MIGIYNAENDTITQLAGNSKVPVWTGTSAEFEALDKSTLQNGTYLNITDDETNIIDDTEAGSGKTYSSIKIESLFNFNASSNHIESDSAYVRHTEYKNGNITIFDIVAVNDTGSNIQVGGDVLVGTMKNVDLSKCLFVPVASFSGSAGLFPSVNPDNGKIKIRVIGSEWVSNYNCGFRIIMFEHN